LIEAFVNNSHLKDGQRGEDIALLHLQRQGYKLVTRNWRCKFGEIDLILRDGETVVFVEVRVRRSGLDDAFLSVDARKQEKLHHAMLAFLEESEWDDVAARLDVVAVRFDASGEHGGLKHARDVLTW
jgi:putative endonuclease